MYAVAYRPKVLSGGMGCFFMAGAWKVLSYYASREEAVTAFSAEENRWMWDNAYAYGAVIFEEQDGVLRHWDSYGHHTLPLPAAA